MSSETENVRVQSLKPGLAVETEAKQQPLTERRQARQTAGRPSVDG